MVLHGHQYTAGSEDGSSGCMTQVQRPTASFSLKEYHYSDIKWWKYSHSDVMGLGALGGCSCDQEGCLSWLLVCISQGLLPPVHIQLTMPKKRLPPPLARHPEPDSVCYIQLLSCVGAELLFFTGSSTDTRAQGRVVEEAAALGGTAVIKASYSSRLLDGR